MTTLRERIGPDSYMDDEGDILPYADVADDFDRPPVSDESIVQGMENLRHAHDRNAKLEAFEDEQKWEKLRDKNPGVHVTLEQHYQDELKLINIIASASSKGGFDKGGQYTPEAEERYKGRLPKVVKGAHANHARLVNHDILVPYHAQELIDAGVNDKEEILFDARTMMRTELEERYAGPENEKAREARRKWLRVKLAEIATAQD